MDTTLNQWYFSLAITTDTCKYTIQIKHVFDFLLKGTEEWFEQEKSSSDSQAVTGQHPAPPTDWPFTAGGGATDRGLRHQDLQ